MFDEEDDGAEDGEEPADDKTEHPAGDPGLEGALHGLGNVVLHLRIGAFLGLLEQALALVALIPHRL